MPVVENWKGYSVSTKATWADPWTTQPDLICTQLVRSLMPTIDRASFVWRSGEILQPGASSFATVATLDLDGYYVKVDIPDLSVTWIGYFTGDRTARTAEVLGAPNKLSSETPSYVAVGIEWFFGRTPIGSSVMYGASAVRTERAIGFNTGNGNGRSINYADRGNKDTRQVGGNPVFAEKASTGTEWTAFDILENLLAYHGPRDDNDVAGPFSVVPVATVSAALSWFKPEIKTEGRTLLQVLNQLIDRRRGLYWWLEWDSVGSVFDLHVTTGLPTSILLPTGTTIPASTSQIDYRFDSDISVASCLVGRDATQKYSRVRARGARRRSVFTVSIADGNWATDWLSADETLYKSAGPSNTIATKNDRYRKASKFERVYQAFRIPEGWDGKSAKGDGIAIQQYVNPDLPQGSTSIVGGKPFTTFGIRLLRTTPLKAGFDYADAFNPAGSPPTDGVVEYLQPFALIEHGNKFVFLDRSEGHVDEDDSTTTRLKTSYYLRPLASVPGFEIKAAGKMPHVLALNHFDPATDGVSETDPEIDYAKIRLTVCAEFDGYCEGFYPGNVLTDNPVQELLIYLGDRYRLDYLAVNTILDIDDTGQPLLCTTGGPIQDDRDLLRDLAEVAYQWYQTPRRTLDMSYHNLQEPWSLGDLIKNIGSLGETYEQTINSTVSQIVHRPEEGKTSMTAGFAELDFAGLV